MTILGSDIRVAVRIETRHLSEVPSCFVKNYDGSYEMRFIDGQDNTGLTFEGGGAAEGFDTGVLIEDSLTGLSQKIDLSTGGNFNTLNSFTIAINNATTPTLWQNLLSNKVYLTNCKVTVYFVIDNVMYARGGGYIEETPRNENHLVIKPKDINDLLFKNIPETDTEISEIGSAGYSELKKVSEINESVDRFFCAYYGEDAGGTEARYSLTIYVPEDEDRDFVNMWISATNAGLSTERKITDDIGVVADEIGSLDIGDSVQIIGQSEPRYNEFTSNGGENTFSARLIDLQLSSSIDSVNSDSRILGSDIERNSSERSQYYEYWNWDANRAFHSTDPLVPPTIFEIFKQETRYQISESEIGGIELDEQGNPIIYLYNDKAQTYLPIEDNSVLENTEDGAFLTVYHIGEGEDRSTYTTINADTSSSKTSAATIYHKDEAVGGNVDPHFDGYTTGSFLGKEVFDNDIPGSQPIIKYYFDETGSESRETPRLDMDFGNLDWESYDNIYLGVIINVVGETTDMHTVDSADNMGLYFSTRDIVLAPNAIRPFGTPKAENVSDFVKKATTNTTNDCYFPIRINGDPSTMFLDSFDNDFYITTDELGAVDVKRAYPSYYDRDISGWSVDKEFDYKTHFKLENNPLRDGVMHLFIEPNAGIVSENIGTLAYKLVYVHLIGEKIISGDRLFVKTTGEKLDSTGDPVTNVYEAFKMMLEDKNGFTDIEYSNVETFRNNWDCARLIKSPTSSKELVKNLAQQAFVAVWTNRFGNLQLDAFRDNFVGYDPDTKPYQWVHDESNIIAGSIKSVTTTNVSKIYNNLELRFHKDYHEDEFTESYFIKNVSADEFPDTGDYSAFSNITDRATAEELWGYGHETFIRNFVSQGLPEALSMCEWYRDLKKDNPNALGRISSSIHKYLEELARWVTQSKNEITYDIDVDADTVKIEIADRVSFSDILITDDTPIDGWVVSVKPDKENAKITVGIITVPEDLIKPYDIIDELPDSVDTLDEAGTSTEDINEDFVIFP